MGNIVPLVVVAVVMASILGGITLLTHVYSLNGIKNKTVGNGQHGTARWATKKASSFRVNALYNTRLLFSEA